MTTWTFDIQELEERLKPETGLEMVKYTYMVTLYPPSFMDEGHVIAQSYTVEPIQWGTDAIKAHIKGTAMRDVSLRMLKFLDERRD